MSADDDELLPWWMHRQCDPSSPDVIIGEGAWRNTTHRSWTLLGTVGSPLRAAIDRRGMVAIRPGGCSIDWWVGADDRWHLPSRSGAVRQRLIDDSPVVETTMRVPGGEVVHRAWAVAAGEQLPGGAVVIELHNASSVPVAVAFAVRPFGPVGRTPVGRIDLVDAVVQVDGSPFLHLPRDPSRVAVGSASLGDALGAVVSGAAGAQWPAGGAHCADDRASAALLFPLPHTATIRVVAPMAAPSRRGRPGASRVAANGAAGAATAIGAAQPGPDRVAAGWEVQTRRSPRVELLERRGPEALAAARRFALLHAAGDVVGGWAEGAVPVLDACSLIVALDQHGLHDEAARLLMTLDERIGATGRFAGEEDRLDAGAAWLHAVASHVDLAGDAALARALMGDLAKVAHQVHRRMAGAVGGGRRSRGSAGPDWAESVEARRVHDLVWARAGLDAAAAALRVADQPAAADEIGSFGAALLPAMLDALDHARSGSVALAALVALVESETDLDDSDRLARLTERVLVDHGDGVVWQRGARTGCSPRLSVALAIARARLGHADAAAALRWLLDIGEPMWAWPEFVHPRTGDGSAGEGHSPVSTAAFLRLVRSLTVIDDQRTIEVLPVVPTEWLGRPLEVHDLPTRHGRLSFAVRWHGARPAVLWDLSPAEPTPSDPGHPPAPPLRFTGLDPTWSTTEPRGEALLAAPTPPDPPPDPPPGTTSGQASGQGSGERSAAAPDRPFGPEGEAGPPTPVDGGSFA